METNGTLLLLSHSEVERLLTPDAYIAAVENAFRQHALGKVPPPGILCLHTEEGSCHVKAALLAADREYFAAKLNALLRVHAPSPALLPSTISLMEQSQNRRRS